MFGLASSLRVSPLRVAFSSRPTIFLTQLRTIVTKRIYVGGLPSDYTDDNIRELISKYEIKNLRTPRFEGKTKGYCFIDVDSPIVSDVVNALRGIVVNDSVITAELAMSSPSTRRIHAVRTSAGSPAPPPVAPGYTSLYVGNLPWTADEGRVRAAFDAVKTNIGQVRIPRDPYSRSKGYAFVEVRNESVDDVILAIEGNVIEGRAIRVGRSSFQTKKTETEEARNTVPPKLEISNE